MSANEPINDLWSILGFKKKTEPVTVALSPKEITTPTVIEFKIRDQSIRAESVVPESKAAVEEAQRSMLQTMTQCEAAREQLGDYCVTFGQGDSRVVMFTTPLQEKTNQYYFFLTQHGPKQLRIVPVTNTDSSSYKPYADFYKAFNNALQAQQQGQTTEGEYTEGEPNKEIPNITPYSLRLPGCTLFTERFGDENGNRIWKAGQDNLAQAISTSLDKAKAPHQAKLAAARSTISAAQATSQVLSQRT